MQGIGSSKLQTVVSIDPATGRTLGEVPVDDKDAVGRAVMLARTASREWAAQSFPERRRVFRALLDEITRRQDYICELASLDSGKTMVDAAMGEVFPVCEKIRYMLRHGERDLRPSGRAPGFLLHKKAEVEYHPLGVIGIIAPWNFPFHNLLCPLIPALFAGNAVVAKVSEYATHSAQPYLDLIQGVLRRCGHNPELVQIVRGYGETGAHLVRSGVDKVFFTGSPETGEKVMRAASETLTPVVLELGGKDPLIICEDADLERAADAAMLGVFTACGQMCVGAERIYVFDEVYDRFVAMMERKVRQLRQGPPLGETLVDCGATTMEPQLRKVGAMVDEAVAAGAVALVGGHQNKDHAPGLFFEPTLLVNVDHTMRIAQEEIFGPVMTVIRVRDEAHALQLANDSVYGLGGSVFTRDKARGRRMASALRSGMAVVNDYGLAYMMQALPFGGVGRSGFGRINGREGLRACCYPHAVVTDRIPVGKSVGIHPVKPQTYDLVTSAVDVLYAQGIVRKARAATRAARNLWAMRSS